MKIIRAVISNLIISVVSEEHEDREKNGPAEKEERIVCDSVSECGGTSARALMVVH